MYDILFYKSEVGILSFHCCILIYGDVAQMVEHWLGARGTVMILVIMLFDSSLVVWAYWNINVSVGSAELFSGLRQEDLVLWYSLFCHVGPVL